MLCHAWMDGRKRFASAVPTQSFRSRYLDSGGVKIRRKALSFGGRRVGRRQSRYERPEKWDIQGRKGGRNTEKKIPRSSRRAYLLLFRLSAHDSTSPNPS